MPVRKLLIWPFCTFILLCVLLTLSMPLAAQEDCLTSDDLSAIALTENSSYSEVTWKVTTSNACDYPVDTSGMFYFVDFVGCWKRVFEIALPSSRISFCSQFFCDGSLNHRV